MAVIIPIVAASALEATVLTAAEFAAELALVIGLNALLAPKAPSTPAGFQTVKQAIPDRVRGWGRCRLRGAVMFDEASGVYLNRVFAFHDGQIDGIERWYLNDDLVYLSTGPFSTPWVGAVNGGFIAAGAGNRYGGNHVGLDWRLGLPTETAYAGLVSSMPTMWSDNCRLDGVASFFLSCVQGKQEDQNGLFPFGKPDPSVVARQSLAYDWRLDSTQPSGNGPQRMADPTTWAFSRNPIVCLVNELWRYRGYDWAARFAPTLDLLSAEADVCDEPVPVLNVYAELIVRASHGDTHIVIDNANGLNPGMQLNLNPAAAGGQTLTVQSVAAYANGYVRGFTVNLTGALGSDHVLREPVTWRSDPAAPATEPRYTVDTFFALSAPLADVINAFRTACDGWISRRGDGAMIIRAGHYYEPTVVLTAADLLDYDWSSFVEDSQAVNELRPQFTFPAADFRTVETDAWRDEDDIAARGEVRSQQFDLPSVQSNSQARRLAKRKMAQVLAANGVLKFKLSALKALGERYVRVQAGDDEIDELADAVVEVMDDYAIGDDGMSITLTVCAADPNADAWNYETEEGAGPILAGRFDVPDLALPTITDASPFFESSGTGGDGVRIKVDGAGPDRTDLTWFVQTRVAGAPSWVAQRYTDTTTEPDVLLETGFVTANASVEVQIAYQTGAGIMSDWSGSAFVDTSTANIAPEIPTNIQAVGDVGKATITWRNPTSANFAGARVWMAAHGAAFNTAVDVSGLLSGPLGGDQSFEADGLAAGDKDFWVTAENAAGVQAPPDGPVEATVS